MPKKENPKKQPVKAPAQAPAAAPAPKPEAKKAEKENEKAVVVKKFLLLQFAEWLSTTIINAGDPEKERKIPFALHGPKARARNHIHKTILERAKVVEEERMDLVKKYAVLDKNGELILDEKTGRYQIDDKKKEAFDKDFLDLMKEKTAFDILPSNQHDWRIVRDIFLNELRSDFTVDDGMVYEEICEALTKAKM